MFDWIEITLKSLSTKLPLEVFVFIGTIIEEIVAPIPSPLVTMLAGLIASLEGRTFLTIFSLAIIAGLSKTLMCWIFYFLGDKAENFIFKHFGKFLGISHEEIEGLGKYFKGGGRDKWVLLVIRALPFMPTTAVSLLSGIIKMNMESYLFGTAIGLSIRSFIFLFIGYTGFASYESVMAGVYNLENLIQTIIVIALVATLGYFYWQRKVKKRI